MYFASRLQAGRMLASQLSKKGYGANCAVIALDDGGVMVGAQIIKTLNCVIMMLEIGSIELPRELEAIAGITHDGSMSYNPAYSTGELDELVGENYQYIEQEKITKLHEMHSVVSVASLIDKKLLKDHNVILVSEGLKSGFSLDVAAEFLKPVALNKLIIATPMASVEAVDHMHILADEIFCLSVLSDYIGTSHYYDQDDLPTHETVVKTVSRIITSWEQD